MYMNARSSKKIDFIEIYCNKLNYPRSKFIQTKHLITE